MYITTKELQRAATILLSYAEKQGWEVISFADEDSYNQKIWLHHRDLVKTPLYDLGYIDDDIEGIKRAMEDDVFFAYDLERIGAILTTLGAVMARDKDFAESESNNSKD